MKMQISITIFVIIAMAVSVLCRSKNADNEFEVNREERPKVVHLLVEFPGWKHHSKHHRHSKHHHSKHHKKDNTDYQQAEEEQSLVQQILANPKHMLNEFINMIRKKNFRGKRTKFQANFNKLGSEPQLTTANDQNKIFPGEKEVEPNPMHPQQPNMLSSNKNVSEKMNYQDTSARNGPQQSNINSQNQELNNNISQEKQNFNGNDTLPSNNNLKNQSANDVLVDPPQPNVNIPNQELNSDTIPRSGIETRSQWY